MPSIWRYNCETPECKYLVVRRDGTIPNWSHFVLGSRDTAAPWALRAYAVFSLLFMRDWAYSRSVWRLAGDFRRERFALGGGDPYAPRHRIDDPEVIHMMRQGSYYGSITRKIPK